MNDHFAENYFSMRDGTYNYCGCMLCSTEAMNALAFLFQYKRLRRSSRLEIKANDVKPESEADNNDHGSTGLFDLLPLELKFHIFTYLSGTYSHAFNCSALPCMNYFRIYDWRLLHFCSGRFELLDDHIQGYEKFCRTLSEH